MSVITPDEARKQVRDLQIADDPIQLIIDNAESYVAGFLDRMVYVDDVALAAARAAAPAAFSDALEALDVRYQAAALLPAGILQEDTFAAIGQEQSAARAIYRRTMAGMVANGRVKAGILLMIGHLYANAEAVVVDQGTQVFELPLGVTNILYADRLVGV